jgi:hypothetical protein
MAYQLFEENKMLEVSMAYIIGSCLSTPIVAGNISETNPFHQHWGLNNNIILDASADLDGVYKLNPNKFRIMNQGTIVDHSKCRFNIYNFNSSKSRRLSMLRKGWTCSIHFEASNGLSLNRKERITAGTML